MASSLTCSAVIATLACFGIASSRSPAVNSFLAYFSIVPIPHLRYYIFPAHRCDNMTAMVVQLKKIN